MRDESVDSLIKKVISARMRESSEGCADENTMAAYLEKTLSPQDMTAFETHASGCTSCQEVLALAMKLQDQEAASQTADEQSARKKTLFRFSIPIPVIGGVALAVVLIAVLFRMNHESSMNPTESQTAALHMPEHQTEAAVRSTPVQAPEVKKDYLAPERPGVDAAPENKAKGFASSSPKPEIGTPALDRETAVRGKAADQKMVAVDESSKSPAESQSAELRLPALPTEAAGHNAPIHAPMVKKESVAQNKPGIEAAQLAEDKAKEAASSGTRVETGSIPPAAAIKNEAAMPGGATVQKMAAAGGSLGNKESIARPPVYAARDRVQSISAENVAPISAMLPQNAISKLGSLASLDGTRSKKSGDKMFYFYSGYWIDRQCTEHQGDRIVEIASPAPEYEQILQQYPELRNLRHALIYWNGKICLLN